MAEALANVKRQLGPGAVILSTRTVSKGGLLGLKGRPLVEITAARETPALAEQGRTRRLAAASLPHVAAAKPQNAKPFPQPVDNSHDQYSGRLLREFGSLKSMVSDILLETRRGSLMDFPAPAYQAYRCLIENAVADEVAVNIVRRMQQELGPERIRNPIEIQQCLSRILIESLPTAGPISFATNAKPYIAALVGPTGVGKTTTIAKLAANFSLRERKKVGLITLDTYRIAAVEQLKTYAQIIDVPLKVAMSPDEYQDAILAMDDRDVILVDSAGRSQRDAMKIQELRGFFAVVAPHETHLVLSSAASEHVLTQAIDRFGQIGFDRVIFSKLDEAVGFGVILGALQKVNARLSYITTGQDVPADIEVGDAKNLASLILQNVGKDVPAFAEVAATNLDRP